MLLSLIISVHFRINFIFLSRDSFNGSVVPFLIMSQTGRVGNWVAAGLLKKDSRISFFFVNFCETFKSTYFVEYLKTTASSATNLKIEVSLVDNLTEFQKVLLN